MSTFSIFLTRCEVNFPRAPEARTQESSYELRLDGASAAGYDQGYQYGGENQQQTAFPEASIEPNEITLGRGEKANLTCIVKGAEQYTVTWTKYAHDTSLPPFARVRIERRGSSVVLISFSFVSGE